MQAKNTSDEEGTRTLTRYEIRYFQERCTGCLRCALACSELCTGSFCPSRAYIEVIEGPEAFSVRFKDDCTRCGACADSCFYDALEKVRVREEGS